MNFHTVSRLNRKFGIFTPRISEIAFIIGAMKSATSTLFGYLIQHPQIAPNLYDKEPEFFSKEAMAEETAVYYRQYFPKWFRHQVALEASTGYTKMPAYPNVAERLKHLPQKKHFIYIVRDPVDRIESHMAHNVAGGENTLDRLFAEEKLAHYLAVSSYAMQLDAYRAAFPDRQTLLLDFEDLKTHPIETVQMACRHIGIDAAFPFQVIAPRNPRRSDKGASEVSLSPAQREMLKDKLQPNMRRFADDYGFDISRWGF
jgi:hypothetical protein